MIVEVPYIHTAHNLNIQGTSGFGHETSIGMVWVCNNELLQIWICIAASFTPYGSVRVRIMHKGKSS